MAMSPSRKKLVTRISFAVVLLAGALFYVLSPKVILPRLSEDGIPLPFGEEASNVQGSVTGVGNRNGIPLKQVSFDNNEVTEELQNATQSDAIFFVLIPDSVSITQGAPLRSVLSQGKRIFGYKYTSRAATVEKAARDAAAAGTPKTFAQLFPGEFFVTAEQRAFDSYISTFEAQKGVVFKTMDQVKLDKNSRYVVVANDASTSFSARNVAYCGDAVTQSGNGEQCDDGNLNDDDNCNNACQQPLPRGNLFVTKSATPVRSRQLLGGVLNESVLRLDLRAETEDVDVTDLVLTASGANAANASTNVDRLEIFKVGETSPFAAATIAGCGTTPVKPNSFCAVMTNQELVVPNGQTVAIVVRPRMRNDDNGAVSGHGFALTVDPTPSTLSGAVRARGVTSQRVLAKNNGNSTFEGEVFMGVTTAALNKRMNSLQHRVVLAQITSIANANPDPDGTAVPTGAARAIGQFKFTSAYSNNTKNGINKFVLSGVIFNVNATNVLLGSGDQRLEATSDFKLYNKADSSIKATCRADRASASGANLFVTCSSIPTRFSGVNTTIDSGSDITFVLEAEVVNPKISPFSTARLQVAFVSFAADQSKFGAAFSHIEWLDKDALATTIFRWIESPDTQIGSTTYVDDAVCGNGSQEGAEQCDDGNQINDDACDNVCRLGPTPF